MIDEEMKKVKFSEKGTKRSKGFKRVQICGYISPLFELSKSYN